MRSRARVAGLFAAILALAVLYVGLRWGALVAGGSDSYGYVSQAGLWQQGSVIVQEEISLVDALSGAPDVDRPVWQQLSFENNNEMRAAASARSMRGPAEFIILAQDRRVRSTSWSTF